jgi:hypothetical protein
MQHELGNFAEDVWCREYYGCHTTYQQHGVALVLSPVISLLSTRVYYENPFRKYPLFIYLYENYYKQFCVYGCVLYVI